MTLDQDQRAAVAASLEHDHVLCIAGPGSGKSTTLAEAVRQETEIRDPGGLVVITFTGAAARSIREKLGELGASIGFIGTLHGYCSFLLRKLGAALVVLGEEEAQEMLIETLDRHKLKASMLKKLIAARRDWWMHSKDQRSWGEEQRALFAYYRAMLAEGVVDYDGLLWQALEELRRATAAPCVKFFVDEYQDSGAIDAAIYGQLVRLGAKSFTVGDPDQSIYAFRGGSLKEIMTLAENPAVAVVKLERNYRCREAIAAAASRLIACNGLRVDKSTVAVNPGGAVERVHTLTDAEQDAKALELVRDEPGSWAVLVRSNTMAAAVVKALKSAKIPSKTRKEERMPDGWKLARRALALLCDPTNWRLGEFYLKESGKMPDRWKLTSIKAKHSPASYLNLRSCGTVDAALNELTTMGVDRLSILMLRDRARESGSVSLYDLHTAVAAAQSPGKIDGDGVYVGTIHSAKGLEWPNVVILGCEDGVLPRRQSEGDDLEEERRLMFVAMTRAEDRLVLGSCERRSFQYSPAFSSIEATGESRFIGDAGL